jgi:hypothetical protein
MTATCPLCGKSVRRGLGRRVKTASRMLDMAEMLSSRIKPGAEGKELRGFVNEGRELAEWLHGSGHTARWGSRDSILPGEWLQRAERLAQNLGLV